MEIEHWPTVRQAIELLPPVQGHYLEIGIGNGYALQYFAETGYREYKYWGLDISAEMVLRTEKMLKHLNNVRLFHADFLQWRPPEPIRFDLVFSMEVFYYFEAIQAGIDKAASLLCPGGTLMVLVNYYEENPGSHGWPEKLNVPMRLWSKADYLEGFGKAGLRNVRQERLVHPGRPDEPGTLATWASR